MNARASAPMTRASNAGWRIGGCLLLMLAVVSLVAASVSAHVTRRPSPTGPASLDVQPFPGTPDASPGTHVSFPALSPSQLRTVRVNASRSGAHPGRLVAAPDGRGADFIPDRPFVTGDHVSVQATLSSPAAGAASGAHGSRIQFSFGVAATQPVAGPSPPASAATAGPDAAYVIRHDIRDSKTWTHTFRSIDWIHPPIVWMSGTDPDPKSSGDVFADVHRAYLQAGPLILNPTGELIWFNPIPNRGAAFNTQVQHYNGQQVLTYWQGYTAQGYGTGKDVILNHHYQTVATVNAGNGYQADLHEFQILPNGDALITAYNKVPNVNLTSIGGPQSGTLLDSIIQEVNIATGHVDWEWHAYGHVNLSETYAGKPHGTNPYDFFHINSIQLLPNGNLLVASRHMWAVYEINMKTGKIPYNFGGKNSSFKFGPGASFAWEHDATMQPNGTMTVFDDGDGYYKSESQSRALRLWIHYKSHQITLVHQYTHNPPLLSESQGSMQVLPDGYTFVGWGSQPYFSEFDRGSSTQQFFTMKYSPPMESYRGFRSRWWGQPNTKPNIATVATKSGTAVYASWNGATDVATWRVLAGSSRNKLTTVATQKDRYFEDTIPVKSSAAYWQIQAVGGGGGVRAASAIVARGSAG